VSDLAALIKALPLLLGLIAAIRKGIDEAETNKTVADHIQAVTEAFNAKDSSKLDALFNK
jgi:DNA-binding FrmR family transcriptional regulator